MPYLVFDNTFEIVSFFYLEKHYCIWSQNNSLWYCELTSIPLIAIFIVRVCYSWKDKGIGASNAFERWFDLNLERVLLCYR